MEAIEREIQGGAGPERGAREAQRGAQEDQRGARGVRGGARPSEVGARAAARGPRSSAPPVRAAARVLALLALAPAAPAQEAPLVADPVTVDALHPDRRPGPDGVRPAPPEPAYGGRAIVHLEVMPRSLNYAIESSGYARRILYELNETLLLEDWETLEWKPLLCRGYDVDDQVLLKGAEVATGANVLVGDVEDQGDRWRVLVGQGKGLANDTSFPKENALAVERETVFTFHLRDDVLWHDGHPFDARDVWFSWSVYQNPGVDCGEKRNQFKKFVRAEILGPHTVRFHCEKQYFNALRQLGDMTILPSHLYDLSDPDNARVDAAYHAARRKEDAGWKPTPEEQARYVNTNPRNKQWVGLGPYELVRWDADGLEARRFERYFDPAQGGYLDTLRWRYVQSDTAAFQALLNGELDYLNRLSSDDFFGETIAKPAFTERFYKGAYRSSAYWYIGWNLHRPELADVRVRRALAQVVDFAALRDGFYKGYADQVTGHSPLHSPGYDHAITPLPYAPDRAAELLAEAGWYDRDGDEIVDKDGVPLSIELLQQSGNLAVEQLAAKMQEDLERIGVKLEVRKLELAALQERAKARDFDAFALAWALPSESDPEQVWHSKNGAPGVRSSNMTGLQDAEVDRLIEAGQRELDPARRAAIWRALHARLYELQPYLWGFNPLRKFAMSRKLHGLQCVALDPHYVLRRWYYPKGTPGTRATRAPEPGAAEDS